MMIQSEPRLARANKQISEVVELLALNYIVICSLSQVTVIIAFLVKFISAQVACLPFYSYKLLLVVRCILLAILLFC